MRLHDELDARGGTGLLPGLLTSVGIVPTLLVDQVRKVVQTKAGLGERYVTDDVV